MIGTSARAGSDARADARSGTTASAGAVRALVIVLIAVLGLVALGGLALAAVGFTVAASPPSLRVDLPAGPNGAADLPLDSELGLTLGGWNARLEHVALYETPIGPDGRPGIERVLAVQATMVRQSRGPDGAEYTLRALGAGDPATPALSPDAGYRLVARSSALAAGLPLPEAVAVEREVRFSTVRSPVPRALLAPARLKWGQPLQITWDAPIVSASYAVSPPTPFRAAIDPTNPQLSTVVLEDPDGGQTYKVTVTEARGANGIALNRTAEYTVIAPHRPQLLEAETPRTVEIGKPLTLKWSVPIERLKLAVEPEAVAQWAVDRRDPTLVTVTFDGLEQGEAYTLTVVEAVSREGAPLRAPPMLAFETPERLMVESWDPEPEGKRIAVDTKLGVTFAQPIRDRRAATAALSLEPAIPGRWVWKDDRTVQYQSAGPLPYETEIKLMIKPGPDGVRSASGAFFERAAILELRTESDKLIDVSISRQLMTLYEKGKVVKTYPVGTGVPGADTPLGEFHVEYKMPTARFRGTRPDGFQYDIPDVKWVLAFMGDYTIHGVYWRGGFGTPSSNGCVGLSDENAKEVFDWAPEGTRIKIHM